MKASMRPLAVIVLALGLAGCLRLPDEAPASEQNPTDSTEVELRDLVSATDLGVCDENEWTGTLVSEADTPLLVDVTVTFLGLGSEVRGTGATPVEVEASGTAPFLVEPSEPIDDLVLTCSIALLNVRAG